MTKEATMTNTERELHRLSKQVTRAAEHFLALLLEADPEALRNNEYLMRDMRKFREIVKNIGVELGVEERAEGKTGEP
jgi:hypothetical protein